MSGFSQRRIASLLGILALVAGLILGARVLYERVVWSRTLTPVRDVITVASTEGLRYPEARTVTAELQARHNAPEFPATLSGSLSDLRSRFEADNSFDPEIAFWLGAGLTVSGDLETARGVVDIGRVHNPFDERLWNLEVILTLREGDSALARERLETLIDMFPENALAAENLDRLEQSR